MEKIKAARREQFKRGTMFEQFQAQNRTEREQTEPVIMTFDYANGPDMDGDVIIGRYDSKTETFKANSEKVPDEEPEGFTYVRDTGYTGWYYCVENLPGWVMQMGRSMYFKKSKIGGMFSIRNRQINTKKIEEAIVLEWNGRPTINGIRYHMSKSHRLEPRYNDFSVDSADY